MLFAGASTPGLDIHILHDLSMSQAAMDHEHQHQESVAYGNEGWVEINGYASQHQSPIHEYGGFGFVNNAMSADPTFSRMAPPQQGHPHQQLLPLIMPSNPTWPSMLTNPASYHSPPLPAPPPPAVSQKTGKLGSAPSNPRKTLTDADRRRMCQYHEDNPSVKQTEIGAMFGVERSTVSKVLRQKEKYLFPEDRSLSPKRKGKFPDIDRALTNWVRNSQRQGLPLTDAVIKEKARFFATTVGNSENHIKANSASWLEKFKQKNGLSGGKLLRRASETNVLDTGSLTIDSGPHSASQTPNGISPTSPADRNTPSPLSASKSEENFKTEGLEDYLNYGQNHSFAHSNSHSNASLSSAFGETTVPSFTDTNTSPSTPFSFSPETPSGPFMPSQQSRPPLPSTGFQRPRSQTFPMLGIDPSFISGAQQNDLPEAKYSSTAASSSGLASPIQEFAPNFGHSSPILHHRSSNGSMVAVSAPATTSTPSNSGLASPPPVASSPSSPTQDDARRALDTLLSFFQAAPQGLVDQNEYLTVLKLTDKLRLNNTNHGPVTTRPGGLHRIPEQENETVALADHSMTAGA